MLGFTIVFIYTIWGFLYYNGGYLLQNADAEDGCASLLECFMVHLDYGMREGRVAHLAAHGCAPHETVPRVRRERRSRARRTRRVFLQPCVLAARGLYLPEASICQRPLSARGLNLRDRGLRARHPARLPATWQV